jgi:hypothetical protein
MVVYKSKNVDMKNIKRCESMEESRTKRNYESTRGMTIHSRLTLDTNVAAEIDVAHSSSWPQSDTNRFTATFSNDLYPSGLDLILFICC